MGAAAFEPIVRRAVELDQFAFASRAEAALAVSRRAAFAGRAETFAAKQTAEGLSAEREAFDLVEFFAEMVIVEAGAAGAGQMQDAGAHGFRQTARARASAAGARQISLDAG